MLLVIKLPIFIVLFMIMANVLFSRSFRPFSDEYYEYFKSGEQNLLLIFRLVFMSFLDCILH